jgi:Protein of unknown function (DUF2934)
MTNRERRIREIAYQLWEQEGRPDGHAERLWLVAEARFEAEIAGGDSEESESLTEPAAEEPPRRLKREVDEPAAEKPARSAKTKAAEPAPEKGKKIETKTRSATAKTEAPAAEKPAASDKRKPKAK